MIYSWKEFLPFPHFCVLVYILHPKEIPRDSQFTFQFLPLDLHRIHSLPMEKQGKPNKNIQISFGIWAQFGALEWESGLKNEEKFPHIEIQVSEILGASLVLKDKGVFKNSRKKEGTNNSTGITLSLSSRAAKTQGIIPIPIPQSHAKWWTKTWEAVPNTWTKPGEKIPYKTVPIPSGNQEKRKYWDAALASLLPMGMAKTRSHSWIFGLSSRFPPGSDSVAEPLLLPGWTFRLSFPKHSHSPSAGLEVPPLDDTIEVHWKITGMLAFWESRAPSPLSKPIRSKDPWNWFPILSQLSRFPAFHAHLSSPVVDVDWGDFFHWNGNFPWQWHWIKDWKCL